MREVHPEPAHRIDGLGVDRLEKHATRGRELPDRELDEVEERRGRKVLEDLEGGQAPERRVRAAGEPREEIRLIHRELLLFRARRHDGVRVAADRGDSFGGQRLEELAAPASEIGDGPGRTAKTGGVTRLPAANLLFGPPEVLFEVDVETRAQRVVGPDRDVARRLRRFPRGARGRAREAPQTASKGGPLEPEGAQALRRALDPDRERVLFLFLAFLPPCEGLGALVTVCFERVQPALTREEILASALASQASRARRAESPERSATASSRRAVASRAKSSARCEAAARSRNPASVSRSAPRNDSRSAELNVV